MAEEETGGRNDFPQFNGFRGFVSSELYRRRVTVPMPITMPFVQFTAAMGSEKFQFFHLGFHSAPPAVDAFQQSYGSEDVVGYAYSGNSRIRVSTGMVSTRTGAEGTHPVPGVTQVTMTHMGLHEPIRVRVHWKCYNTTQLEFLQKLFGVAGAYVVCEVGHTDSMGYRPRTFRYTGDADGELAHFVRFGRKRIVENYVANANGNYDLFVGQVTNYEISFQPDGSYECFTEFYSIGEALFGLGNHKILRYWKEKEDAGKDNSWTINDYFSESSREFERLLEDGRKENLVVSMKATSPEQVEGRATTFIDATQTIPEEETTEQRSLREDTRDRKIQEAVEAWSTGTDLEYVPWNFLLYRILPHIFVNVKGGHISPTGTADSGVSSTGAPVRQEIKLFQTINRGPNSFLNMCEQEKNEPVVGDNPYLCSTRTSVIIVKPEYVKEDGNAAGFDQVTAGSVGGMGHVYFGAGWSSCPKIVHSSAAGRLSSGVWLSVDMIREQFLLHNSFKGAFQGILYQMNNAVVSYWDLALIYDEDAGYFKVIDKNFVAPTLQSISDLPIYQFNKGTAGELLDLTFDASFADEMKTIVLLSNRIKTDGPANRYNTIPFMGPIGPGMHGQFLSRSPYDDVVEQALERLNIPLDPVNTESELSEAEGTSDVAGPESATPSGRALEKKLVPFRESLKYYIKSESEVIDNIRTDAHSSTAPNAFLAPVPTEMRLELTVRGISGIAFFDVFDVAKLPAIYQYYGVFAVNGIEHTVDPAGGWKTKLDGFYYFCFPEGRPNARGEQESDEDVGNIREPTLFPGPPLPPIGMPGAPPQSPYGSEAEMRAVEGMDRNAPEGW